MTKKELADYKTRIQIKQWIKLTIPPRRIILWMSRHCCLTCISIPGISQPAAEVIISWPPCDVIHHECTCSTAIITSGNSTEPFLTSCIPDLQLDLLSSNFDNPCAYEHEKHSLSRNEMRNLKQMKLNKTQYEPNSTPMVCGQSDMNFFSVNWWRRQLLPTPISPMMMYLKIYE